MSIGSINPLSYVQSILTSAIQGAGSTTDPNIHGLNAVDPVSSVAQSPDNSRLSPFAQMLAELQQLQQSDPAKYTQVTQQIASNLQTAAQTATTSGNTTAAAQLTQLASDFTSASKSGQLPSVQDLAQVAGAHHHHHHAHAASADSATTSSTDSSSTSSASSSSASQTLSQLLAAFQTGSTQSDTLNPMSIIMNTLSSAGITATNA
jgi:hypothetical protein